jgi:hypothetical protein
MKWVINDISLWNLARERAHLTAQSRKALSKMIFDKVRTRKEDEDEIAVLLKEASDLFDEALNEQGCPPPPRFAEFLVTLCVGRGARRGRGKGLTDTILDDLEDCYQRDCERIGPKRAALRYWAAALRSSWPHVRDGLARLMKWAAAIGIVRLWSGR